MLLKAHDVSIRRGHRQLLERVGLQLEAGELVGLIGPNGAGKSTLLSILAGLVAMDDGEVRVDGRSLTELPLRERSQTMAWVEQSGPINWPLSVERIVTLGRRPHLDARQRLGPADRQAIEEALRLTDCAALRYQDATTLSGGERSRVLLARALAVEPRLLLADEPVSALDLGHQLQTMEVLRAFADSSRGALVVLHDLSLAARFCDRLYLLHHGHMVANGSPMEVLTAEYLQQVYGVTVAIGCDRVPWIVPLERLSK